MMEPVTISLIAAGLAGLIRAGIGWWRNRHTEKFQVGAAIRTVSECVAAGAVVGAQMTDPLMAGITAGLSGMGVSSLSHKVKPRKKSIKTNGMPQAEIEKDTHPAVTLNKLMIKHNLTADELSEKSGITLQKLYQVLAHKSSITKDMAKKLQKVFGTPVHLWTALDVANTILSTKVPTEEE